MPTLPSREPWLPNHNGDEGLADRRQRTSDDNTAKPLTAISRSRQLRYKEKSEEVGLGAPLRTVNVDNCTKGEFVKGRISAVEAN